jgi:hypothetical protein
MGKLFTVTERGARVGSAIGLLCALCAGTATAAPPDSDAPANATLASPSSDLPPLVTRTPALELLWFDPTHALPAAATDAVVNEVRRIFETLGVDVGFRAASAETTYEDDGAVPEIPVILLADDPIVARRASRVLGLVVRNQEPSRAVWAFLENVRWTLGHDRGRELPAATRELGIGQALGRVVAHEVIHALAPAEPHARNGLMGHAMNRAFLLGNGAPLDARCARAFLSGLAARSLQAQARVPGAALAAIR